MDAPVEELLTRAGLYHLHTYVIVNRFRRFRVYYAPDSEQALFIAPPEIMIHHEGDFRVRDLTLGESPWEVREGLPALPMKLDGEGEELFNAANIEKLLAAGETRVYQNDHEAHLTAEHFAELEKQTSLEPGAIFKALTEGGYWPADGVLTTREARLMQGEGPVLPEHLESSREAILDIVTGRRREKNAIAERWHRPAGLFNFGKGGVNFAPAMGRGEHNVYFEFLIGNRYGSFTPYSFLDATGDPELSVGIYRELVEAGEILNERGRLADASRIRGLRELKSTDNGDILKGVIEILEAARPPDLDEMVRDMGANRTAIRRGLENHRALPGLEEPAAGGAEHLPAYVKALPADQRTSLLRYYREARMNREIETEIVKNRGIVLADDSDHILLLITDPVVRTAPYYSMLLNFFREKFPGAPSIQLAYAYCKPGPRNVHEKPHPVIQALIGLGAELNNG